LIIWRARAGSQSDGLGCVDVDARPGRLSEAPWRLPEGRAREALWRPGKLSEAPWRLPEGEAGGRGGGKQVPRRPLIDISASKVFREQVRRAGAEMVLENVLSPRPP